MRQELTNWKLVMEGGKGRKDKSGGKVLITFYTSFCRDQHSVMILKCVCFTLHTEEEGSEGREEEKERERPNS